MSSLREALQKVEPAGAVNSIRELADLMKNYPGNFNPDVWLSQLLQSVSLEKRIVLTPLTFFWQNTALFPSKITAGSVPLYTLYKGAEREKVLPSLIQHLRSEQPDVVGFCEVWVGSEKQRLRNELADIYPYSHQGPWEDVPRPLEFEYFDGGLLLLSKYPIVNSHQTIYRQCAGEDCLTNKGALHARIAVPGHPVEYDVFITHMQSCPPEVPIIPGVGSGSCEERLEISQVNHLSSFIQAYSSPECVALLMGDLNINGQDQLKSNALFQRLKNPTDLWKFAGAADDSSAGITNDSHGSFQSDRSNSPSSNPNRNLEGGRLDYLYSGHLNRRFFPLYENTKVVNNLQSSPGRDLSDHYGLKTHLKCIREILVEPQTIQNVQLSMTACRCLRETGGPIAFVSEIAGNDEMQFRIWGTPEQGAEQSLRRDNDDVDTGDFFSFPTDSRFSFNDPGSYLNISFKAWEVDEELGITTGEVSLGPQAIHLPRVDLLYYKQIGLPVQLASPVLQGDGGEYIVFVELRVT